MIHGDTRTRRGASASVCKWYLCTTVGLLLCIFVAQQIATLETNGPQILKRLRRSYWADKLTESKSTSYEIPVAPPGEAAPAGVIQPKRSELRLPSEGGHLASRRKLEIAHKYCLNKNYHNPEQDGSENKVLDVSVGSVVNCTKFILGWVTDSSIEGKAFKPECCAFDLFRLLHLCNRVTDTTTTKPTTSTTTSKPTTNEPTTSKPTTDEPANDKSTTTSKRPKTKKPKTKKPKTGDEDKGEGEDKDPEGKNKPKTTTTTQHPAASTTATSTPDTTTTGAPTGASTTTTPAPTDTSSAGATTTTTEAPQGTAKSKSKKSKKKKAHKDENEQ